jgi:7,8-dihydro-6-hydroxymethylpterin dimethyltransferase
MGSKVPGGWCGFYGACGAGIGAGIAVSILTEATPLKGPERSLAIAATAFTLSKITDSGARCCKRMLRKGMEASMDYLNKTLSITLVTGQTIKCRYVARNKECTRLACPYF